MVTFLQLCDKLIIGLRIDTVPHSGTLAQKMKTQKIIFSVLLIALTNGCAYFTNIYERPKEVVAYNYYHDFYGSPVTSTTKSIIKVPCVCVMSSTVEPIEELCFEHFNEYPHRSMTALLFYMMLDFPLHLATDLSTRGVDFLLFSWWLDTFEPEEWKEDRETSNRYDILKEMAEKSPYVFR